MKIRVDRIWSDEDVTISEIFIDDEFFCHGLEDEYRAEKVPDETRIPLGEYAITLRTVGGFHQRYLSRFPDLHQGMLWVRDVPGFTYILIHIGNTEDDTSGCLLLGVADFPGKRVLYSARTYQRFYAQVWEAARDDDLTIEFQDLDRE
ncbi:DUF5675 family protein [Algimonas porphyrae]|uniref:DUF5675 domain-containing protein n=1 Tax=Algimonas porphyrae TaxID=1128113 RepID=A0ABQ5V4L8_9PROT|nr:DUF5675 family protein [Algimonas porphyrae]GLQ21803.1 hypothetical protein GCM10007854_27580 [Algimonas porphyrae]